MSCPYFDPVAPQVPHSGAESAMLPLGDSWAGICRATPDQPWQPDHATLGPLCNLGYARGHCVRFPRGDGPDAVRFTVSGDDGATVRLYYVIERDHHPFAHGPLEHSHSFVEHAHGCAEHTSAGVPAASLLLERQAHAYAQSYLRRKGDTEGA